MGISLSLISFALILILIIALQIYLCRRKNRRAGLILPIICLIFSIIVTISTVSFSYVRSTTSITHDEAGNPYEETTVETTPKPIGSIITNYIGMFLYTNIPTIILLLIYWVCTENKKKRQELEKMNIQDLE